MSDPRTSEGPALPFDFRIAPNEGTKTLEVFRGDRLVAWIDERAVKQTGGLALWHFLNKLFDRFGIAPVALLPTHHKPEPEWEPGEVDPGYLWHLFMGRDPDTYRSRDQIREAKPNPPAGSSEAGGLP